MSRYIFVIGGVISSVGKGITVGALGRMLKDRGFAVSAVKIDPYINIDAGTMNPTEHGEVFVTTDGDETDQDIGNYERFLDTELTSLNYMTQGRVYQNVLEKERNLGYGGKCVQPIPHIPEEVIARLQKVSEQSKADFIIVEIGGTVGEYENLMFLEMARMMHLREPESCLFILVSYLFTPKHVGEMKTKPTQHAARALNGAGIQPDFIVCRGDMELDEVRRKKLAIFCNVRPEDIISAPDLETVYLLPEVFEKQNVAEKILEKFHLKPAAKKNKTWDDFVHSIKNSEEEVHIAVVGKYFETGDFVLADSYVSVIESIKYAAWFHEKKPVLTWIDSTEFETDPSSLEMLKNFDGLVVPGGFGTRGIEGIIAAIGFARKNNIPYLGLCYGMQLACIEIARTECGFSDAHTVEANAKTKHPVIHINPVQQKNVASSRYGGTMRLGNYECDLSAGSMAQKAYGENKILERHRHRYEFNNDYREALEKAGCVFSGVNAEHNLVEIVEFPGHPFFLGTQFHPEFKSRPGKPHPLFREFLKAAIQTKK